MFFQLEQIEGSLEDKTILTVLTGGNMSPQEVGFKNRRNLKIEPCLPKEPMFILNKNKKKRVLK